MGMLKNKWFWVAVVVAIVLYISMVKKRGPLASMFGTDSYEGEKDAKTPIRKGPMGSMMGPRRHGKPGRVIGKPFARRQRPGDRLGKPADVVKEPIM